MFTDIAVTVGVRISVFGPGPGISPVVSQCCNARNFDRTAGPDPEPVKTFHHGLIFSENPRQLTQL